MHVWDLVNDGRTEYGEIPPIRDLLVYGHEASMDIRLLSEVAASVSPDPLAVVQKSMHEEGSNWCKWETVSYGEGWGEEKRAVSLVCLEVEGAICVDDPGEIVNASCVVEDLRRHQGQVRIVPNIGILHAYTLRTRVREK
jgi:hypothetical protein